MRCSVLLPVVATAALACAGERGAAPGPVAAGDAAVLKAAELARVRCLVVAPFENGSDAPLASETATSSLVSGLDAARVRVFPIQELRWLFRDTPLDLPAGIARRSRSSSARCSRRTRCCTARWKASPRRGRARAGREHPPVPRPRAPPLFARTVLVAGAGERTDSAVRRAVLAAARPALSRLGDDGEALLRSDRTRSLRKLALAQADAKGGACAPRHCALRRVPPAPAVSPASAPPPAPAAAPPPPVQAASTASAPPAPPPPAAAAPIAARPSPASPSLQPARAIVRTPRQTEWMKRLRAAERFVLEDVAFAGRSDDLQRDVGLADLAVALLAEPSVSVRLEAFVDATPDPAADRKLSTAMAQAAAKELAELGVPRQRVTAVGHGGESPRLPNFTARGRSANRRIEAVPLR
jgi:outer membrane protein OmpA-like peptidoglycan-associated protein